MNYPSIRIEGAILSSDILDRIEDLPGQRPADFGLNPTDKVKDEIALAWADAQNFWSSFQRRLETIKSRSSAETVLPATTETRQQWMVPFLGLLGYKLEYQQRAEELNGKTYNISHRVTNRGNAPVHIIGYNELSGLDRKPERSRMSAHATVQEYLNFNEQLYGIVTNGQTLRLLRDSSRLVKLSYLEFDLDRIFTDGLFADFAVLYRLIHATRLPVNNDSSAESIIEQYHQDSLESGERIRDGLSKAVEGAIRNFGNGFLAHPDNDALRNAIATGDVMPGDYYKYLLRLIYRLLFLMVIEERDLVFPSTATNKQRDIYRQYYSLDRLRRMSEKRYLADRKHHDIWLALTATFRLFESSRTGEKLGILPLAGDLFQHNAIGRLAECTLNNEVLLGCLKLLSQYENPDNHQLIRVNYGALNVEEFGSVYEGLLELEPIFITEGNHVLFSFTHGEERAATGSHYTPDELVQPLIKHSLDYLIADKLKEADPEKALLSLRVADISCGSGHILLAAARRIATELAIVRTGEEQPSPLAFRIAIRDVISDCIYGVDLNPLAVELCKVALWLESHNPGEPLHFLDHHIKCGNAIVGFTTREELERGVPDEAFKTLPGDDKETAAILRKRNQAERKHHEVGQLSLAPTLQKQIDEILHGRHELDTMPNHTPEQVEAKKARYLALTQSQDAWTLNQIAAIPIAQFYLPKTPNNQQKIITDSSFRSYWRGDRIPKGQDTAAAWAMAEQKRFFHWFLEFPEIIERGGFDCILGNPPYLGGTLLSGTYGYPLCEYVKWEYSPTGLSELVVYFARRIFTLLKKEGFTAFITTNSIKDGDVRRDGLEQILLKGGVINMAMRGIKWPGRANLVVSLIAIHKGKYKYKCVLNNNPVDIISPFLENTIDIGEPIQLTENMRKLFKGADFLGDGFLLSHQEAHRLIQNNSNYSDVIFPVINGQEINNSPDQKPGRSIINFHDWSKEKASTYSEPFEIVERLVKPFRLTQNRLRNRDVWWIYSEHRPGLVKSISSLSFCFVVATTTKYLNFSVSLTNYTFTSALFILTVNRWDIYSVVQSTIHEVWARKYSGALETRLRYSPTDCFENFAFPESIWQINNPVLALIGEHYHEYRRNLMLQLWLGLTDIYNLFHARDLTPERVAKVSKKTMPEAEAGYHGIIELRRLHVELDIAVRDAYGWNDLDLGHDFHEVETLPENDRVRYTISPTARKEVLKRLLAENHKRAAAEAANQPVKAVKSKQKKNGSSSDGGLF